jgi:hypothetical protein
MNDESSLARNVMTDAISSGAPIRFIGCVAARTVLKAFGSGFRSTIAWMIGVSAGPGLRIPRQSGQ